MLPPNGLPCVLKHLFLCSLRYFWEGLMLMYIVYCFNVATQPEAPNLYFLRLHFIQIHNPRHYTRRMWRKNRDICPGLKCPSFFCWQNLKPKLSVTLKLSFPFLASPCHLLTQLLLHCDPMISVWLFWPTSYWVLGTLNLKWVNELILYPCVYCFNCLTFIPP